MRDRLGVPINMDESCDTQDVGIRMLNLAIIAQAKEDELQSVAFKTANTIRASHLEKSLSSSFLRRESTSRFNEICIGLGLDPDRYHSMLWGQIEKERLQPRDGRKKNRFFLHEGSEVDYTHAVGF